MNQIRILLRLDAVASGGLGVVLVALAGVLEGPLGLAVTLSVVVGLGLLAWSGFVTWVSAHPTPALVREVVVLNLGWVAASITFATGGWGRPHGLGCAVRSGPGTRRRSIDCAPSRSPAGIANAGNRLKPGAQAPSRKQLT